MPDYHLPRQAPGAGSWLWVLGLAAATVLGGYQLYHSQSSRPASAPVASELPSAESSLAKARKLLDDNRFEESIGQARVGLTLVGEASADKTRALREVLASAYLGSGQSDRARRIYQTLSGDFPLDTNYLAGLRKAEQLTSQLRRATAKGNLEQARQAFAAHHYREAGEAAHYAAQLYDQEDGAARLACLRLAGQAFLKSRSYREAELEWYEVARLQPGDPEAARGLAEVRAHPRSLVVTGYQEERLSGASPTPLTASKTWPTSAYPVFKGHGQDDEFYGDSSTPGPKGKSRKPPSKAEGSPNPEATPDRQAASAPPKPTGPRLPSLSYPQGASGSGLPGYNPPASTSTASRSKDELPPRRDDTLPSYSSSSSGTLPGYDTTSTRGNNTSSGLPGYGR